MSEVIKPVLAALRERRRPSDTELLASFTSLLAGELTDAQIGAFLMGLETAGVDSAMISLGAAALRAAMTPVTTKLACIDVCGTGGDGAHTLNISTAVSFVLAGAGQRVAKHGNRAMSSKSGAGDVLEALGVKLSVTPTVHARALEEAGISFLFAQAHHPAMRFVGPARRDLGIRTIFNLLGPLANPAGARRQLLGVFAAKKLMPMAEALRDLGCEAGWVVHGDGGLDEVSLSGPTQVAALQGGQIRTFEISPQDAGLTPMPLEALAGGNAEFNAIALKGLLAGERGPYRDSVLLNAAAALMAVGAIKTLLEGIEIARDSLDSGRAMTALKNLIQISNEPSQ